MSTETTPKTNGSLITPFNFVAAIIVVVGLVLTYLRFFHGIGAVTNLDDNNPWGIWIGFDLMVGVALAAGGYTTSAACYIFGFKKIHSCVRPAILTAFLGYALVVFALHYDVGRPWRLPYPIFVSQGTTSLLFEVGLCVFLYLTVLFLEFTPAAFEWLGMKKMRNIMIKITMVLTIFGVILSTLHQSSLGALFLIAPSKLHPLWYSPYLAVFFFISSMFAGMSMVIAEGTLAHRKYSHIMSHEHHEEVPGLILGFAKACAMVQASYFTIKVLGIALENKWHWLGTGYGAWFLVELIGFVGLPCLLYAMGAREKRVKMIRWAAFLSVAGIILNRLNVSLICFNWQLPSDQRYVPHLMEIGISVFVVTVGLIAYKFIVTRMPIFYEHPDYKDAH